MTGIQWCGVLILATMAVAYVVSLAAISAKSYGYTVLGWLCGFRDVAIIFGVIAVVMILMMTGILMISNGGNP